MVSFSNKYEFRLQTYKHLKQNLLYVVQSSDSKINTINYDETLIS